ncbi:MAG: methyltransferase domain-containing protein [Chlamydiae bacterium]|nr:methyltransferase domain-containing protein [Chlamydiota bacterium]
MATDSFGVTDDSTYIIVTGERDKERLTILSEIYNPFSLRFFTNCNIQKGARVLELGCGIGIASQMYASEVGKDGFVLATDISEQQLQVARTLLPKEGISNLEFRQLSAFEIDGLNEQFDVVCARFLLVHLQDHQKVIQKVKKIIKPGGKLIIEDITGNQTFYSSPHTEGMDILHHLDRLQCEVQQSDDEYLTSLPALLEKEGFRVVSMQKAHPKLGTPRKRKSILFHLSSLKDALIRAEKTTEKEYNDMLQKVIELEQNSSVEIYYYEFGQLCATF